MRTLYLLCGQKWVLHVHLILIGSIDKILICGHELVFCVHIIAILWPLFSVFLTMSCLGLRTTLVKEAQKCSTAYRELRGKILVNFYWGAIESILTGNITNWHGSSLPRTGRLYSRWLETPEHLLYHLKNINDITLQKVEKDLLAKLFEFFLPLKVFHNNSKTTKKTKCVFLFNKARDFDYMLLIGNSIKAASFWAKPVLS